MVDGIIQNSYLWSLRMRASRLVNKNPFHISGAEGIYELKRLPSMIRDYYLRAMNHPRGCPDNITITIEAIKESPLHIPLLPVMTIECPTPQKAKEVAIRTLLRAGVSEKAIRVGLSIVGSEKTMRGAAMVVADSGLRVEPDRDRGVRVSRLGIERETERRLSRWLKRKGINTTTVKEALILASKVAFCRGVLAELCVSDDPDYTTGYVASRITGYVRITNLKKQGSMRGGRVFFVMNKDVAEIIDYLERKPVIAKGLTKSITGPK